MLTIGVINNMPLAAIQSTERQFRDVLHAAGTGLSFELRWFRLAGARPDTYKNLDDLWRSRFDGLIVTGTEPKANSLADEPLWGPLTRTIDWSAQHTSSVIWSCLSAHAAVLYLDGVERRAQSEKIFGIYDSMKLDDHPLLANIQSVWPVPHSRWNDLSETDLVVRGYTVLAKSSDAGVDLFVKQQQKSLFVFVQTHPEYAGDTLLREYRRDLALFHTGQRATCPRVPHNYFDDRITAALETLRRDIITDPQNIAMRHLEQVEVPNGWKPTATQLYRNWLLYLASARQDMGVS